MYIKVSDLPETISRVLVNLKYNRKDIELVKAEKYYQQSLANKGQRGFTCAVNIETGDSQGFLGSWGGANPFVSNAIDSDNTPRDIPTGFVIIQGTQGHPKTYARILIHPNNLVLLLPENTPLTKREDALLAVIKQHTSAGRKHFWDRYPKSKPTEQELECFINKGLLKINKAGAISITTDGKNAVTADSFVWYSSTTDWFNE